MSAFIILAATLTYGLLHSLLAALRVKAWARRRFGPAADRWYRLAYNLFAVVSLLPVLALVAALPDRPLYRFPQPWFTLALAGQAAAVLMAAYSLFTTDLGDFLGLRRALGQPVPAQTALATDGLYAWVRHPLYTASLLFLWLTPAMTVNRLAFYVALTLYLVVGALFEERKLLAEFGEDYADYRRRVPMLIPRPPAPLSGQTD